MTAYRADTDRPGSIPVYPPTNVWVRPAVPLADTVPELIHYKFNGTGTSVPNLASSPPPGTATAMIMGGVTQTGLDLNLAGNGFSLLGTGVSSTTDFLNTGWATNLTGTSWTISFASSNFTSTSALYYAFGDVNAGGFRCFTNGVAGANNWILRGTGITDVLVSGGATAATHRTTFVYDMALGDIKAYLDGVLVNTVPQVIAGGPVINGPGPFKFMGYGSNVGSPAGGLLDDFRVYNRALSALEVMDLDSGQGQLTITPSSVPFGNQVLGSTSAPTTVTLANAGTAPLNVTALTAASAPFARSGGTCSNMLPINLPVGANCTLDYTFAPTATGPFNQSLTVTSDALGSGTINLSGTGIAVAPTLTYTPDTAAGVTFPSGPAGTANASIGITSAGAVGIGQTAVTGCAVTGPDAASFGPVTTTPADGIFNTATTTGSIDLSCTRGLTVANASLSCTPCVRLLVAPIVFFWGR